MPSTEELQYQDTIALLQEELARLEGELRLRDEAAPVPSDRDREPEAGPALGRRVADLTDELASRDETIGLLVEQGRLFEEAETASRADWEQLHQWVEEVERRVERRDEGASDLRRELEAERRRGEEERQASAAERRAWQIQRQAMESESSHLRAALAKAARAPEAADSAALEALERENGRLRDLRDELARAASAAADVLPLRVRLQATLDELDAVRHDLRQALDDLTRERTEHEAALAALRSQSARESLRRQDEQVAALAAVAPAPEKTDPVDERIRALRLHLREIHDQEQGERDRKRLSARLSRLWRHSGTH